MCKVELAAMFAHWVQDTGTEIDCDENEIPEWRQGLHYLREACGEEGSCCYRDDCESGSWTSIAYECYDD